MREFSERTFTLFYGENLHYYFQIDREKSTRTTAERVLNMKKIEGSAGSKYQLLNQMLSDRRLDKKPEVKDGLKELSSPGTICKRNVYDR